MCRLFSLRGTLILALLAAVAAEARADGEKPTLYLLSVGVSEYQHPIFWNGVRYAAKDAKDVAAVFHSQEGRLFEKVNSKVLVNGDATRSNIQGALAWLKSRAASNSVTIVFFAGHGGPDSLGQYTYLPYDAHPLLQSSRLGGADVREALESMAGRRLLILDTCHAGALSVASNSFVTLAGCTAQEKSSENTNLRNGFFTSVLVEALQGKADVDQDGNVTLTELNSYLKSRLASVTGGLQHLVLNRPAMTGELSLSQVSVPVSAQAAARIQTAFVRVER